MRQKSLLRRNGMLTWAILMGMIAACILIGSRSHNSIVGMMRPSRLPVPEGTPQLISVDPLPDTDGQMCQWVTASTIATSAELLQQPATPDRTVEADRAPLRTIRDPNPAFSAIAVEPQSNKLVITDENLFQVLEYDRRDKTPPGARMTEPKRVIGGTKTKAEMMCGVYIDPKTLDTYVLNNDTQNYVAIFSNDAKGNVPPSRFLIPPGGHTFGIAMDEQRQEMFLTIQATNLVVVYSKMASGRDRPLRTIFGENTHLEDPHGVAVDTKRNLLFVSNHGSVARHVPASGRDGAGKEIRGSGVFHPPSIAVYPLNGSGNISPIRLIEGPKARLNWPAQMAMDEETGQLYVANDMDHSVVVFGADAQGDVAPIRVIQGSKTGIRNPTGIALDLKNQEVWVSNMGNHSAAAFPLQANGDVTPLRVIRGGPANEPALMIGNPGGVGYDTKREEILVPN